MFSKVGNRNAQVFHLKPRSSKNVESPDSPCPRLWNLRNSLGLQGDNLVGWLVFWSTFLNKGIGDLKGQRPNLEKFVQLHVSKLQPHPSEKKQNSSWWLTGSQGLQPKDSSVDSVFLSKMHHGCSRRLSFSCVIQHMWAKKLSHDVSCIGITNIK